MLDRRLSHARFTPLMIAAMTCILLVSSAIAFADEDEQSKELQVVFSVYLVTAGGKADTPLPDALSPVAEEAWSSDATDQARVSSVVRMRGITGDDISLTGPLPSPDHPEAESNAQHIIRVAPDDGTQSGGVKVTDMNLHVSLKMPIAEKSKPDRAQMRGRSIDPRSDYGVRYTSRARLAFGQPELLMQTYFGPDAIPVLLIIQADRAEGEEEGT